MTTFTTTMRSRLEARIRAHLRRANRGPTREFAAGRYNDEPNPNAIEIYVHRVRKKLTGSDVGNVTLRGIGYSLAVSATNAVS
jgi:DNA-binding response OmpR family regulator